MRNVLAFVIVLMLAVLFAVLKEARGIDIPMSIRFLAIYIVSVLMID